MSNRILRRAEIVCVGTELLIGDIVNTNAAYIARRLATLGIGVYRQSVVGDNPARLGEDVATALTRADLVVMSGGLGPTYDDLTKETVAALFGRRMQLHAPSLARIEAFFASVGRPMTENNRKQAMMPEGAMVFDNDYGTAPALALENEEGQIVVMLPGPPRELEPLFREKVEPFLATRADAVLFSRNLHILGMGESRVEDVLPSEVKQSENPTVAPYCKAGEVRLRVTARAKDKTTAEGLCDEMVKVIKNTPVGQHIYGIDVDSPEAALVAYLAEHNLSVATAESCTGGLVAKRLTDIAGSSAVVAGGAVTYQNRIKEHVLGVSPETLAQKTAVSRETAIEMANGARALFGTDLAVSLTGYAGPGGGTEIDPVGTVYIAVAAPDGTVCTRLSLSPLRDRDYIRTVAATNAILLLLRAARRMAETQ